MHATKLLLLLSFSCVAMSSFVPVIERTEDFHQVNQRVSKAHNKMLLNQYKKCLVSAGSDEQKRNECNEQISNFVVILQGK
jgi:hypothetical protein